MELSIQQTVHYRNNNKHVLFLLLELYEYYISKLLKNAIRPNKLFMDIEWKRKPSTLIKFSSNLSTPNNAITTGKIIATIWEQV